MLGARGAAVLPLPAKVGQVEIGIRGHMADWKAERFWFRLLRAGGGRACRLSDAYFADFCETGREVAHSLRVLQRLHPRTLTEHGPRRTMGALTKYMNGALDRAIRSGVHRSVGQRQFVQRARRFPARAGVAADGVVPADGGADGEGARHRHRHRAAGANRSNIINSGAEAFRGERSGPPQREHDHPTITTAAGAGEPQILEEARDAIAHLHFANRKGRGVAEDRGRSGYVRLFAMVKKTASAADSRSRAVVNTRRMPPRARPFRPGTWRGARCHRQRFGRSGPNRADGIDRRDVASADARQTRAVSLYGQSMRPSSASTTASSSKLVTFMTTGMAGRRISYAG